MRLCGRLGLGAILSVGKQKVFCIGFNKTGTTSLETALKRLGYVVGNQHLGEQIAFKHWAQRDFRTLIWFCRTAQAFQDLPFSYPDTYKALDAAFPGSRFILTVRDSSEQWYESLVRFHAKVWSDGRVPPTKAELEKDGSWYIHRNLFDVPEDNPYQKDVLIGTYERHNAGVVDHFRSRPENLLVLNVGEKGAYGKLCGFLDKPCSQSEFPWENKT